MGKIIHHYKVICHQQSQMMTRSLLEWVALSTRQNYRNLVLSANCTLEPEASHALVCSQYARSLQSLELTQIYFSPQQLRELLTMPALVELRIWGALSADENGVMAPPLLTNEHLEVLSASPYAQKLRVLELRNQDFHSAVGNRLRQALPQLKSLQLGSLRC